MGQRGRPRKLTEEVYMAGRELLACRTPKGEIKRLLKEKYDLTPRNVEEILARARDEIRAELGKPRTDHQADALEFYTSVIRSPLATFKEKIRAQEGLDRLLGLSAQFRSSIELSGPNGEAVNVAHSSSAIVILPSLDGDEPHSGNGNGNGNGHLLLNGNTTPARSTA